MSMFSRSVVVLLIVLLGIFSFTLLCVPAELPPAPGPQVINSSMTISYGETWEEAQVHSGNESYYGPAMFTMHIGRRVIEMMFSTAPGAMTPDGMESIGKITSRCRHSTPIASRVTRRSVILPFQR